MALSILDGTQTATTLSTILSSGQHITAHTVVSLGSQAISDITSAVSSGISVSVSSALPSGTNRIGVVTIGGGTVTIGEGTAQIGSVTASISGTVPVSGTFFQATQPVSLTTLPSLVAGTAQIGSVTASISGTIPVSISSVTIGNSITISSLPSLVAGTAQIGSVTASISGTIPISIASVTIGNSLTIGSIVTHGVTIANTSVTVNGTFYQATQPISISSVTIGNFPATQPVSIASVTIGNSITIGSLPAITGTVTANTGLTQPLTDTQLRASAFNVSVYQPSGLSRVGVNLVDASGTGNYGTSGTALKVSGSVTLGAGTAQIGSVTIGNSITIGSIQGGAIDSLEFVSSVRDGDGNTFGLDRDFPVTGSVAIQAGNSQIGSVTASLSISSTPITSGIFTSVTSATLVPSNTSRKMATIYNLGAGQLFVQAGTTATTLGGGFMVALSSGDFYECDYTTTTLSGIFATTGTASWMSH